MADWCERFPATFRFSDCRERSIKRLPDVQAGRQDPIEHHTALIHFCMLSFPMVSFAILSD